MADNQLQQEFKRADKLRITLAEISEYTGVPRINLWRWREGKADPSWARREKFIGDLRTMIAARKDKYRKV